VTKGAKKLKAEEKSAAASTGVKKKDKTPAVQQEDPLQTQKSKKTVADLTDPQRKALNKFFKVPTVPKPSAQELATMDKAERKALLKSYDLPKWAVRAVLNNPQNLSKVLKGEITPDSFKDKNSGAMGTSAQQEWKDLKAKHPDVALLQRPQSASEKQLRKGWLQLVKKWGKDAPGLPRPKQERQGSPARGSRGRSQTRGSSDGSGQDALGGMSLKQGISIFAELAKAFRAT
jgi:hypothetical protein